MFPGYETRIHLCEDHKADRLVATVARSTRWPDSINYSENHHYHCNSTIMFLLPLFAVNLRNTVSSLSTEYPIEDDQRRMLK